MHDVLSRLRKYCYVGVVSGSDLCKVSEQLALTSDTDSEIFCLNFCFSNMYPLICVFSRKTLLPDYALYFISVTKEFDYVFSENGLVAFKNGELLSRMVSSVWPEKINVKAQINNTTYNAIVCFICLQNIVKHMGDEKLQTFINFVLRKMSEITLPVKR